MPIHVRGRYTKAVRQPSKVGKIGFGDILDGSRPDFLKTADQFEVAKAVYEMLLDPTWDPAGGLAGPGHQSLLRKDITYLVSKIPPSARMRTVNFLHNSLEKSYDELIKRPFHEHLRMPATPGTPPWMALVEKLSPDQVEKYERDFQDENGHFAFEADGDASRYHFAVQRHQDGTVAKLKQDLRGAQGAGEKVDTFLRHAVASVRSSARAWKEGIREGGLLGGLGFVTGIGLGKVTRWLTDGSPIVSPDLVAKVTVLSHIETLSAQGKIVPVHDHPEGRSARVREQVEQLPRDGGDRLEMAVDLIKNGILGNIQNFSQTLAPSYVAHAQAAAEKLDLLILASRHDRVINGEKQQSYLESVRTQRWFNAVLATVRFAERASDGKEDPQSAYLTHYPGVLMEQCDLYLVEAKAPTGRSHGMRPSVKMYQLNRPAYGTQRGSRGGAGPGREK